MRSAGLLAMSLAAFLAVRASRADELTIEPAAKADRAAYATLRGADARLQLVVTRSVAGGQLRDVTHQVAFEATPPGLLTVDGAAGGAPPAAGEAVVTARTADGLASLATLKVEAFSQVRPVNF